MVIMVMEDIVVVRNAVAPMTVHQGIQVPVFERYIITS